LARYHSGKIPALVLAKITCQGNACTQYRIAIAVLLFGGRWLLRPVFHVIAGPRLRDILAASALLLVIGIALLMILVELSPALGTFLAGVVLADSEYRNELEPVIEPCKGLLVGLSMLLAPFLMILAERLMGSDGFGDKCSGSLRIFISYSSADTWQVNHLVRLLESEGFDIFVNFRDLPLRDCIDALRTDYSWTKEYIALMERAASWNQDGRGSLGDDELGTVKTWLHKAPDSTPRLNETVLELIHSSEIFHLRD
jgi:hypothetical protein